MQTSDAARWIEIEIEFDLLENYISLIKTNYNKLIEGEKEKTTKKIEELQAEENNEFIIEEISAGLEPLENGIIPRFLSASAIIAIWGAYESFLQSIATKVARDQRIELQMSDLKGDFLQRSKNYFRKVLDIDMYSEKTDLNFLAKIYDLRNALAHANGRLSDIHNVDVPEFKKWLASRKEVDVVDEEYLIVSFDFVEQSFKFVKALISELTTRLDVYIYQSHPNLATEWYQNNPRKRLRSALPGQTPSRVPSEIVM